VELQKCRAQLEHMERLLGAARLVIVPSAAGPAGARKVPEVIGKPGGPEAVRSG
jgi:hypothetical protein